MGKTWDQDGSIRCYGPLSALLHHPWQHTISQVLEDFLRLAHHSGSVRDMSYCFHPCLLCISVGEVLIATVQKKFYLNLFWCQIIVSTLFQYLTIITPIYSSLRCQIHDICLLRRKCKVYRI